MSKKTKKCCSCKLNKKLIEFGKDPRCKSCIYIKDKKYRKKNKLKIYNQQLIYNYGINLDRKKEIFSLQQGLCAICNITLEVLSSHTDHDHKTGKIRGLLCDKCNRGLGYFDENTQNLQRAIFYLIEHK